MDQDDEDYVTIPFENHTSTTLARLYVLKVHGSPTAHWWKNKREAEHQVSTFTSAIKKIGKLMVTNRLILSTSSLRFVFTLIVFT